MNIIFQKEHKNNTKYAVKKLSENEYFHKVLPIQKKKRIFAHIYKLVASWTLYTNMETTKTNVKTEKTVQDADFNQSYFDLF